ncbi:MAG TPA: hypothetical protein VGI60_07045 [Chthoniobacterales bacterium]|jgi:hypothetical protein
MNREPDQTEKPATKPATSATEKPPPVTAIDRLISDKASSLSHLECITEMFEALVPILKEQDQARQIRMKELLQLTRANIPNPPDSKLKIKISLAILEELLGHARKLKQADRMFRQSTVTSMVSNFDELLTAVLRTAFSANPSWLLNSDRKLSYAEILQKESLEKLKTEIISKEINELMYDSHHAQLTFIDAKLKLGIEANFKGWSEFLEITERRNLFVHTGGAVSNQYLDNCRKWKISLDPEIAEGTQLQASDHYIKNAVDCFYELTLRVVHAAARRLFPEALEKLDNDLNDDGVLLLTNEQWALAERVFEYALGIPTELRSRGQFGCLFLINLCIALKFGGKDYTAKLNSIDWSPYHPKFHLAVAVLEDRFADAVTLMRSPAVLQAVTEHHFKSWPLLKEFRKTPEFEETFRQIFNKDFTTELLQDAAAEIKEEEKSPLERRPSSERSPEAGT